MPAIHGKHGMAYDVKAKSEAIADSFEDQFTTAFEDDTDIDFIEHV